MKNKLKTLGVLTGLATVCIALIYLSWRQGEARRIFEYQPLEKAIPLPILFESLEGEAEPLGDQRIRANWRRKMLPREPSRSHLLCLGSFRPVDQVYYVLELDGQLYLEKGEFVEPLIFAMYSLHVGPGKPTPGLIRDAIILLPDSPEEMVELAARIKKKESDPED